MGGVVLGRLEQAPADQRGERPLEGVVVDRLVPPGAGQGAADVVEVERRRQHGGVAEGRHQGEVEVAQLGGGEAEEVGVDAPPDPSIGHPVDHREGVSRRRGCPGRPR